MSEEIKHSAVFQYTVILKGPQHSSLDQEDEKKFLEALAMKAKDLAESEGLEYFVHKVPHKHEPDTLYGRVFREEGATYASVQCKICKEWGSIKLSSKPEDYEW